MFKKSFTVIPLPHICNWCQYMIGLNPNATYTWLLELIVLKKTLFQFFLQAFSTKSL